VIAIRQALHIQNFSLASPSAHRSPGCLKTIICAFNLPTIHLPPCLFIIIILILFLIFGKYLSFFDKKLLTNDDMRDILYAEATAKILSKFFAARHSHRPQAVKSIKAVKKINE